MSNLNSISKRGYLKVGVSLGFKGFSEKNCRTHEWHGFDVDYAKALAIALFNEHTAIEFVPLASKERFRALTGGGIDIGCFNATISFKREMRENIRFSIPTIYDGEVFATRRKNLKSEVAVLSNTLERKIAVIRGSTTFSNVEYYSEKNKIDYTPVFFDTPRDALESYELGETDIYCLDFYLLNGELSRLNSPQEHVILNDEVSLEAMAPAFTSQSSDLLNIMNWTIRATIEAERLAITSQTVHAELQHNHPKSYHYNFLKTFYKKTWDLSEDKTTIYNIISSVGNYEEIFSRSLGAESDLKLPRRSNILRQNGGLLSSPLFI